MIYDRIYFIGIGGIGMSALARFFLREGKVVAGYDRTTSSLTLELETEGATIHYEDDIALIPSYYRDSEKTLVVYTPAIPDEHRELTWFREQGFNVVKRSAMLGELSRGRYLMAVAGTHGKTTASTLTAWLNHESASAGAGSTGLGKGGPGPGSAFLGGVSTNLSGNLSVGEGKRMVVEADEFDRSFLQLYPDVAVITSVDEDHLDIYGDRKTLLEAFYQFASQVKSRGALILKKGLEKDFCCDKIDTYTYSLEENADFFATNITRGSDGLYTFDLNFPDNVLGGCRLGIPGRLNIENAVAASALMWVAGFDRQKLREALSSFRGVRRRFEIYINTPHNVYIDDYAHHPRELEATLNSVREMFAGRKITAVFQPHLYSRTRDFARGFARSLSLADDLILLPVYPARELPIDGVDSGLIAGMVTVPCDVIEKDDLCNALESRLTDVVVTFGAGDIDRYCDAVAELIRKKEVE